MVDVQKLKSLGRRYREFRNLENGITPQRRGQQFNQFVADVLGAYEINARASIRRTLGEIDVTFALNGTRFILEAKWEDGPVNQEPVAKMTSRLAESLTGTYGIVLSMGGFTPEAILGTHRGKRLSLILMDSSHFEAILSGVLDPNELIGGLVDHAAFFGDPTLPIGELIESGTGCDAAEVVAFGPSEGCPADLVAERKSNWPPSAEYLFRVLEPFSYAVGVRENGKILVTTPRGLLEVDDRKRTAAWLIGGPSCLHNAVELPDQSVAVVRGKGVIVRSGGDIKVAGGALDGNARVFLGPHGELWSIENGSYRQPKPSPASLTRFGATVGDEQRFELAAEVASPQSMLGVAATDDELYIASNTAMSKIAFDDQQFGDRMTKGPQIGNPGGLAFLGSELFGVSGSLTISQIDPDTLALKNWVLLNLWQATYDLAARGDRELIVSAPCKHDSEIPHQAIVSLRQ